MTSPGPALPFRTGFPPALALELSSFCGCPEVPVLRGIQPASRGPEDTAQPLTPAGILAAPGADPPPLETYAKGSIQAVPFE